MDIPVSLKRLAALRETCKLVKEGPVWRKMMNGIAYCGLTCQTCPIYLATRQENKEEQTRMRAEIVRLCNEQYGMAYDLAAITDCDGCSTEGGRLFSACSTCPIRKCARQKRLENCAYCPDYTCEKLEAFFKTDSAARVHLDTVRIGILQSKGKDSHSRISGGE